MDSFEQTIYWLLSGSKGSANRIKILHFLEKNPANLNELSKSVGLNYKTTQHHIELLIENNLLVGRGNRYGQVYFWSEKFSEKRELFNKFVHTIQEDENHDEKK